MSVTNLLDLENYSPDSINLRDDPDAADYWFKCMLDLAKKFSIQAVSSSVAVNGDNSPEQRAANYLNEYSLELQKFRKLER